MSATVLDFFENDNQYDEDFLEKKEETYININNTENNVVKVEINQSFPRLPLMESLAKLIEYRVKLLSFNVTILNAGARKQILTNITIGRKPGKLSIHMKGIEGYPFQLVSEGYINSSYRGNVSVTLQNLNDKELNIPPGTLIGYIFLTHNTY